MYSGDSLLLTRSGYKRLDEITDEVEVISEYTNAGGFDPSFQMARVKPSFVTRSVKLITRSGRPIVCDYGMGYFLIDVRTVKRQRVTKKALYYLGEWGQWQSIIENNQKVVMSTQSVDMTYEITEDDWAFYTYGFTDIDDPDQAFPLPKPAAVREDVTYKPLRQRRQRWPMWYWQCTLSEKAMFLRGLYDAYGRMTKERVYFSCPNDTFSQNLVIALSEFGIRATRFITEQILWKTQPREYIVDLRNGQSIRNMIKAFYWSEPALPSYRVSEAHRHAYKKMYFNPRPTASDFRIAEKYRPKEQLYRLEVNESHNAIINGLIVRDSTGAYN